jgi:leucyl aminopeptidase
MTLTYASKAAPDAVQIRLLTTEQRSQLPPEITEAEFSMKPGSRVYLHSNFTLYAGLGERTKVNADTVRLAAGAAAMALKKTGRNRFTVQLSDWAQFAGAAVEGIVLADYRYEDFKTKKTHPISAVTIVVPSASLAAARKTGERAATFARHTNLARGIANRPGNIIYPETLAEEAQWHAKKFGVKCSVFDEKKLIAGKFGGILSVGKGSERPPRLIVLEHAGGAKNEAPLVLIGKAVTFDSGGISIKQAADMEKMIWDKCGGAAVICAMFALKELGVKKNVVGLIPSAENMPSANAYRPGDIVTCYDGKTVEIVNTDAEGRMLLADAIGFARRHFKARAIVDIATLTGACGVALGDSIAGLWSNDDALGQGVSAASKEAGEQTWPMPHIPKFDEQIRSEMGLLKNSGGRLGGACTAAAFLRTFAGNTPWAHLDIAYTAYRDKETPALARGASGFGVGTLVRLAEQF